MKKAFLLLLFFGRVLDQKTRESIDFASVFFNGTFLGTTTAEDGSFELDVTPYAGRTLQISAMVFEDEFLGLTKNAGDCHILNEKDITFNCHTNKDTLRALSRKPLIILNNSLGCQITYHLDKFEYDRKNNTTFFTGNIIFNMDLAPGSENRIKIEKRRMKPYTGSCKHFFNAFWKNEKHSLQPVESEEMVVSISAMKYFSYPSDLEISYNHFLSTVSFRGPGSYFAKDGFFESEGILWYGTMSLDRIADWLPYEYTPH